MTISHETRANKIKTIISVNFHLGEQVCADKINKGGFPGPGPKITSIWKPEHIKPMLDGKISMKPVRKKKMFTVTSKVNSATLDIIWRNSNTNSGFILAAINEKIEREGLV